VWVDDDYCQFCRNDGHIWQVDAFANIAAGLRAVAPGGTVYVLPGRYEEGVRIDRPCRLVADSSGGAIIAPRFADVALTIAANQVTVEGLTVLAGRRAAIQVIGPGFQQEPIRGITIRRNRILGGYFGVAVNINALASAVGEWEYGLLPATGIEIRDNLVSGCTRGIYVYNTRATIAGNTVSGVLTDGIGIYSSRHSSTSIRENTVTAGTPNARAIYILDNESSTIERNTLIGTTEPLTPTTALALYGYRNVLVANNTVQGFQWGLNALTGGTARIAGNTFDRTVACALSVGTVITSTEVTIENNTIRSACWGLRLDDDGGYGLRASVQGNAFHENITGVLLGPSVKKDQVRIRGNIFCGHVAAALRSESLAPIDATDNWWGANDGPRPDGSGALVEGLGRFMVEPWLRLQASARTEQDGRVVVTAALANIRYRLPGCPLSFRTDRGTFAESGAAQYTAVADWRGEAQATLNLPYGEQATVTVTPDCGPGVALRVAAPWLWLDRQAATGAFGRGLP
ncbi:MAG: right-handed parallel beta-helix repeat-containing protein, partial [Anaerolineae bacterium]|nr:right-handed parallel beta-helix repeat-containing protein [Anaerolineae bacterium]